MAYEEAQRTIQARVQRQLDDEMDDELENTMDDQVNRIPLSLSPVKKSRKIRYDEPLQEYQRNETVPDHDEDNFFADADAGRMPNSAKPRSNSNNPKVSAQEGPKQVVNLFKKKRT